MSPKRFERGLLVVLLLPLLASCSSLLESEQPAKQYYLLQPLSDSAQPSHPVRLELDTVPGLDTDRVQALANDASLHRYGNARWPDNLPEVLGSVMGRSLDNPNASGSNWHVDIEVREFFGRMNSAGDTTSVSISASGTVECNDESHRLDVAASAGVGSQSLAVIVAAHQNGLNDITRQLIAEMETACAN